MKLGASIKPAQRAPVRRTAPARPLGPHTAAARAFAALGAQPALVVGAVNDPLEREAESNAERVASGGAATVVGAEPGPPAGPMPGQSARREGLNGQPSLDALEQTPAMPETMNETNVPAEADVAPEKLDVADMTEIQTGGEGGDDGGADAGGDESAPGEPVQTDRAGMAPVAVGPEGGAAPADVAARVGAPGAGRPLPADLRGDMERKFDADFSHVTVHDGDRDRRDAARLGARAFTHGRHVWLGPGESLADRRLVAHELTHVVQQTGRRRPRSALAARRATLMASAAPIRRGWIADKADSAARHIPGYTLLCVAIGKSPITGDAVPRTAENLVGGLMGLAPGGTVLFDQLKQANVVQDALDWVSNKLTELDLSWARIKRVVARAIDDFSGWHPIESLKPAFQPLFDDIATFAIAVKDKVVELIIKGALKLAGPYAEKVWEIIGGAREAFKLILDDPLGFAKNLIRSVVKGFGQFGSNIVDHLKRGLLGWLFGAIEGADIKMPAQLDLKGVLSIGFQLLGLTWERWRKKIVKKLDPHGDLKVTVIEKAVDFIRILVAEGFAGVWQRMLAFIDGFKQTVVEGVKGYVISSIVQAGIGWLAGLSNPVGAIIKLALAIYDMIVVFLERLDQILEVAKSLFASVTEIAKGNIAAAADKVEDTIGRTVPVVISFIAGLLRLNGISAKIKEIIKKLRTPVDKALEKLLTFVVKKVKALFAKIIKKLNKKRKLPSTPFRFGKKQHKLVTKKKGRKVEVMVASTPEPVKETTAESKAETAKLESKPAKAAGQSVVAILTEGGADLAKASNKVDLESARENQLKPLGKVEDEEKDLAAKLETAGETLQKTGEVETNVDDGLFRAQEPRYEEIEGDADTYKKRGAATAKPIPNDPEGRTYSRLYQNDHIPEKQLGKAILAGLGKLKAGPGAGEPDRATDKAAAPPAEKEADKPTVGVLGASVTTPDAVEREAPALTEFHRVHTAKGTAKGADVDAMIEAAGKKDDPIAAIKEAVRRQINAEVGEVAKILRNDTTASKAIKAKTDAGVKTLLKANEAFYGLDRPLRAAGLANRAPGANEQPNAMSAVPFLDLEGDYEPYGKLRYKNAGQKIGSFFHFDHVIDQSWPKRAEELTFGSGKLKGMIDAKFVAPKDDPEPAKRREALDAAPVFEPGGAMALYSEGSGQSVAIYRLVHLSVTAKVPGAQGSAPLVAGVSDGFVSHALDYLKTGSDGALAAARKAVKAHIRTQFDTHAAEHVAAINAEYAQEPERAAKANPGKEDAARARMAKIKDHVQNSLHGAGKQNDALFS